MPASVTWKGPTDQLVEASDSPSYDASDRTNKTRIYHGLFSFCESSFSDFAKGTAGTGSESGFQVATSKLRKLRGDIGQITVVWEAFEAGSGQPLPPDEVTVSGANQSPRTERNPIYVPLQSLSISSKAVMAIIDDALRAPTGAERDKAIKKIDDSSLTSGQKALAKNLISKIQNGNESYYLATLRYTWTSYSYSIPTSTRGGYVETISGPLASYFVSGIEWLREADDLALQNGVWRLTKSWLGSDGWDTDLYP